VKNHLKFNKMLGGFNKLMRNIVAGATDTEFEKVSLKPHTLSLPYLHRD